jgi:hypothetical protein
LYVYGSIGGSSERMSKQKKRRKRRKRRKRSDNWQ